MLCLDLDRFGLKSLKSRPKEDFQLSSFFLGSGMTTFTYSSRSLGFFLVLSLFSSRILRSKDFLNSSCYFIYTSFSSSLYSFSLFSFDNFQILCLIILNTPLFLLPPFYSLTLLFLDFLPSNVLYCLFSFDFYTDFALFFFFFFSFCLDITF